MPKNNHLTPTKTIMKPSPSLPLPVPSLSSPDETQTVAPQGNRITLERGEGITPDQVIAFMADLVTELSSKVPGYSQVSVTAIDGLSSKGTVLFRAYNEHTGHSVESKDPFATIKEVAAMANGKTESEMLRKNAQELLDRAAALEGRGK